MTDSLVVGGDDIVENASQDEIESLASLYAEFVQVDASNETQHFDDSIEDLLGKLDEYHGLLDMIRSDTTLCLHKNLPLIREKNKKMQEMFDKIDKLESYVSIVRRHVGDLEIHVDKAESELGTFSSLRKAFSSLPLPSFLASKSPQSKPPPPTYNAPDIFNTKDFIASKSNQTKESQDGESTNNQLTSSSGTESVDRSGVSESLGAGLDFGDNQSAATSTSQSQYAELSADSTSQSVEHLNDIGAVTTKSSSEES